MWKKVLLGAIGYLSISNALLKSVEFVSNEIRNCGNQIGIQVLQTHHGGSGHEKRAAMTELSKLLPVVFTTVQLSILLIVPVGQVVRAHRTPEGSIQKTWSGFYLKASVMHFVLLTFVFTCRRTLRRNWLLKSSEPRWLSNHMAYIAE